MTIAEIHGVVQLPADAFDMWERGELDAYLHVPDGSRAEVVGGEIVVSPCPSFGHGDVITQIIYAAMADPSRRWRPVAAVDLCLRAIRDGYVPDIFLVSTEDHQRLLAKDVQHVFPADLAMAVEVTSPSNAGNDRPPGIRPRRGRTKWNGYAATGVPYYLVVDRDPRVGASTLCWEPAGTGYGKHRTWTFGEPIELPEPFGITIETGSWTVWQDD